MFFTIKKVYDPTPCEILVFDLVSCLTVRRPLEHISLSFKMTINLKNALKSLERYQYLIPLFQYNLNKELSHCLYKNGMSKME